MVAASAVALCRNLCTKILQCHAWCAFGALRVLKLSEGSGFPFKCRFGIPGWVEVKRSQWQGRLSGSGTRLQLVDPALPKSRVFLRLLSPPLGPGRVEEPLPPPSALHGFYLEPGSGVRKTEVFKRAPPVLNYAVDVRTKGQQQLNSSQQRCFHTLKLTR